MRVGRSDAEEVAETRALADHARRLAAEAHETGDAAHGFYYERTAARLSRLADRIERFGRDGAFAPRGETSGQIG